MSVCQRHVGIRTCCLSLDDLGTDHQRIAKLDRENDVAPPSKIAPSVGKVHPPTPSLLTPSNYIHILGHPDRTYGQGYDPERSRTKSQREALCHTRL